MKNNINVYPMGSLSAGTHFETMLLGSFKKPPGFFIPDVKYLVDPKGFLNYLGLKVKTYYMFLYCNGGWHPFGSFEAVKKHIKAKK